MHSQSCSLLHSRGRGTANEPLLIFFFPSYLPPSTLLSPAPEEPVQRDRDGRSHREMIVRSGPIDGLQPIPAALDDLACKPPPRTEIKGSGRNRFPGSRATARGSRRIRPAGHLSPRCSQGPIPRGRSPRQPPPGCLQSLRPRGPRASTGSASLPPRRSSAR